MPLTDIEIVAIGFTLWIAVALVEALYYLWKVLK